MQATDALVNIASLGFGHADSIIRAAKDAYPIPHQSGAGLTPERKQGF